MRSANNNWQRVEELYLKAVELSASQRHSFLVAECGGDDELLAEVNSLLEYHDRAGSFIERGALGDAANHSLVGGKLGPYQILSLLGSGGMGEVYRAQDERLRRDVAIKILVPDRFGDPDSLARLHREARVVAALSHPNILAIHDIGSEQGITYLVMELLEGETLRSRIDRSRLSWQAALEIGVAIADGLAAAHAKGITHRDLKPDNIFLTSAGQTKILDFGIARVRNSFMRGDTQGPTISHTDADTKPGTVIGTINYMSPEQLRGEEADAPSDVFAFGSLFYEMLAGRRPFARETSAETMAAILSSEPEDLAKTGTSIPRELRSVLRRCFEKSPSNRYQSGAELASALRGGSSASKSPFRSRRFTPSQIGLVVAIIAALALAAGLAWKFFRRETAFIQPRQTLVLSSAGSHREASFSPDGNFIAFISDAEGTSQVYVKNLAGGDPLQITSGEVGAERPRWSPNNDQIVFSRGGSIWSVAPLGGPARKLIEDGSNPDWSGDGTRLVYEKDEQIWIAKSDGSDQRLVKGVPDADILLSPRSPALSPDGSKIAFFQCSKGPIGDIWVIPTEGGSARRLTFDDHFGGTPEWSGDGKYIIFSSQRGGSRTLWKINASGGAPEPVLVGAGEDTDPALSRDGKRLIYTNTRNNFVLTLWNPTTNQTKGLIEARYEVTDPSFSPDGSRISFFMDETSGDIQVYTIASQGGNPVQMTTVKGERNIHPRWSPDGLWLYFYQFRPGSSFRRISFAGGISTEVASGWSWGTHNAAQIDPEGKRIAYVKQEKGGPPVTLIREIEGSKEVVFRSSFFQPVWSRDGKSIAGTELAPDASGNTERKISICAVETRECRQLTSGRFPRWSRDGEYLYFMRNSKTGSDRELWVTSVTGGNEKRVGVLQVHPIGLFYDVSPTGEIVYVRFNSGKSELWEAEIGSR